MSTAAGLHLTAARACRSRREQSQRVHGGTGAPLPGRATMFILRLPSEPRRLFEMWLAGGYCARTRLVQQTAGQEACKPRAAFPNWAAPVMQYMVCSTWHEIWRRPAACSHRLSPRISLSLVDWLNWQHTWPCIVGLPCVRRACSNCACSNCACCRSRARSIAAWFSCRCEGV